MRQSSENVQKNLGNLVKSCKNMIFVDFETIFTCTSNMGMYDPCYQILLEVHVQLTGVCTHPCTYTCIQAYTHTSTCTYCPCSYNHTEICTCASIQTDACSQTGPCIHCCMPTKNCASTHTMTCTIPGHAHTSIPAPASQ